VIVVSGIMAAGKSTVSQLLAERFQYGVHLRGDVFRRMIVSGQASSVAENGEEAQQQLKLRYRLACQAADGYPRPDVIHDRLGYGHEHSVDELDYELHAFSPRRGLWLDNSDLSPNETVDAILGRLDEARFE